MDFKPAKDATTRFSSRVDDYVRYRPGYPAAVVGLLRSELGLESKSTVADIGSGTGIFTELLLKNGNRVYAVEPNADMRAAAERLLGDYPGFISRDGTAEATGLESGCADLAVSAQAFHWFDPTRARDEFLRILRPPFSAALVWNDRRTDTTPFLRAYESLLTGLGTDYQAINHRNVDASRLEPFFGPQGWREATFPNEQRFDWAGLLGRALSSSYVPGPDNAGHAPFVSALRDIFDTHRTDDEVVFEYDTRVYYGPLRPA